MGLHYPLVVVGSLRHSLLATNMYSSVLSWLHNESRSLQPLQAHWARTTRMMERRNAVTQLHTHAAVVQG